MFNFVQDNVIIDKRLNVFCLNMYVICFPVLSINIKNIFYAKYVISLKRKMTLIWFLFLTFKV